MNEGRYSRLTLPKMGYEAIDRIRLLESTLGLPRASASQIAQHGLLLLERFRMFQAVNHENGIGERQLFFEAQQDAGNPKVVEHG